MMFGDGKLKLFHLQGVVEGVETIKAEVVDGINKVQADMSESITNGIEKVRQRVQLCILGIVIFWQ